VRKIGVSAPQERTQLDREYTLFGEMSKEAQIGR
jgi:hypothetical protein